MEKEPFGSSQEAEYVKQEIRKWLLAIPAFSVDEVQSRGQNPWRAHLIRLKRKDGGIQLPTFQFDEKGKTIPVVMQVNEFFNAEQDPWGAASWWLGRNTWLEGNATPASTIGKMDDELFLELARAAGGE